jgi:Uma2 family endonuclease
LAGDDFDAVPNIFYALDMAEPVRKVPAPLMVDFDSSEDGRDPFVFGWRLELVRQPGGGAVERQVPLDAAALVDPQIGDCLVQGSYHYGVSQMLFDLFDRRYRAEREVFVSADLKICWGIEGLEEPAPDVAVTRGVRDKEANRDSFDVVQEGVLPCLVIEVVSSRTAEHRRADYEEKVRIYQQAGVPEYLLVDPQLHLKAPRMRLSGHRLDASGLYRDIEPDRAGRLLSETTGVWFTVSADGQRLWLVDAETGEKLLTSRETDDRVEQEAAARQNAEALAEREAVARRLAEELAEREATARRLAEELAGRELAARRLAEELAEREMAARLLTEDLVEHQATELARLREELARLKGSSS